MHRIDCADADERGDFPACGTPQGDGPGPLRCHAPNFAATAYGEAPRWSAWSLPTIRRTCRRDAHGNQLFTEGCAWRVIRCVRRGGSDWWDYGPRGTTRRPGPTRCRRGSRRTRCLVSRLQRISRLGVRRLRSPLRLDRIQRGNRVALRGRRSTDHLDRSVFAHDDPCRVQRRNHAQFSSFARQLGSGVGQFDITLQRSAFLHETLVLRFGFGEIVRVPRRPRGEQKGQPETE